MKFLTALKWTKCLNKSLVNVSTYDHVGRAICCQNNRTYLRSLTSNVNNVPNDTGVRCDRSVRHFSVTNGLAKSKDREKKKGAKAQHVNINELSEFVDVDNLTSRFDKVIQDLKDNFVKHLTLRSSTGAIDQVPVSFEGQDYQLQELAEIARKPKVVVLNVNVFPQAIPQILDALSKSGMNLNPQQDGTTIFIPIPKVTREHRENLSKNAKALYIKSRDNIKDVRNKEITKLKKQPSLSVDTARRLQAQLETLSDQYINQAEKVLETKQKDLLGSAD